MRMRWTVGLAAMMVFATAGARPMPRLGAPAPPPAWRVTTLEHVDLWLHGFALLTSDTGRVPFFARGYKQAITATKKQQGVFTLLDANQRDLSNRFATNPALANAQFVAMYFSSFQEIVNATEKLMVSQDPRSSRDPDMQQAIALLNANFRSPADRNCLRLFVQGLQDESVKFYHGYWTGQQQARAATFQAVQEQWASRYYPKLSRFLNNTQQASGQLVLSLPLGGEGRTINDGKQMNLIAVEFPATPDVATEALFVFVHEAVATLVGEAITDNSTPAQQRSGESSGFVGNGAVRGGALVLKKIAPELVTAYMRFYTSTTGLTATPKDVEAAFAAAFPVPDAILAALAKQIDVILGGI